MSDTGPDIEPTTENKRRTVPSEIIAALIGVAGIVLGMFLEPFVPDILNLFKPKDTPVYDAFDGVAVDPQRWQQVADEVCATRIENDHLTVTNEPVASEGRVGCHLKMPDPVNYSSLRTVEADVRIDQTGAGYADQGISLWAEVTPGTPAELAEGWWSFCGLVVEGANTSAQFIIHNDRTATEDIFVKQPVPSNEWYTFRVSVDPETSTISCWVDDTLLGRVLPNHDEELKQMSFGRVLSSTRDPDIGMATHVDTVIVRDGD